MQPSHVYRAPLILAGQVYLNPKVDEYIVVVRNKGGKIYFRGHGIFGTAEDEEFLEAYPPVDPDDIDNDECEFLLSHCPELSSLLVAFTSFEEEVEEEVQ